MCAPLELSGGPALLELFSVNPLMARFLVPLHRMLSLGLNRWRRIHELIPHSIWCRRESEAEFRCVFKHGGGAFAFRLGFRRCREAVSIGQLNWSTPAITAAFIFGACVTNHWRFCIKIPFPKKTNYALTFETNGSYHRRHRKLVPLPPVLSSFCHKNAGLFNEPTPIR